MPNRPIGEIMRKQRVVKATEHTTVGEAARLMKAALAATGRPTVSLRS